jgi:hypothetical protein
MLDGLEAVYLGREGTLGRGHSHPTVCREREDRDRENVIHHAWRETLRDVTR